MIFKHYFRVLLENKYPIVQEFNLEAAITGESDFDRQEESRRQARLSQPIEGIRLGNRNTESTIAGWIRSRDLIEEAKKEKSKQLGFEDFELTDSGLKELFAGKF